VSAPSRDRRYEAVLVTPACAPIVLVDQQQWSRSREFVDEIHGGLGCA